MKFSNNSKNLRMETCLLIDENDLEKLGENQSCFKEEAKRKYDTIFLEDREGAIEWDLKPQETFNLY